MFQAQIDLIMARPAMSMLLGLNKSDLVLSKLLRAPGHYHLITLNPGEVVIIAQAFADLRIGEKPSGAAQDGIPE